MSVKADAIREHNTIHHSKEERAIKISQYLNEAADLMELYEQGKLIRVIKCENCRHFSDNDCPAVSWGRSTDDFCSWAERYE